MKPWEAEGVSYRTWRRRRAEERGQKFVTNKYVDTSIGDAKMATPKRSARPAGRAAKPLTLSADMVAKLREAGRIAAAVNKRASAAAIALARVLSGPPAQNATRFTSRVLPVGKIEQSQQSIPVKIRKRRAA